MGCYGTFSKHLNKQINNQCYKCSLLTPINIERVKMKSSRTSSPGPTTNQILLKFVNKVRWFTTVLIILEV